jgi:hypothetical protein
MESAADALDLPAMNHARFPPSRAKKIKGKNVRTQLDLAQGNNPLPSCVEFRSEPPSNPCWKGETQTWMQEYRQTSQNGSLLGPFVTAYR